MKAVLQRVTHASVKVDGEIKGKNRKRFACIFWELVWRIQKKT